MTRLLAFTGPRAAKRFELLWTTLHFSSDKAERSPSIIRKEARLQNMLEGISSNGVLSSGTNIPARVLEGEPTLTVAQEDFDFLQQTTEKIPWTPVASRDVVDLWDWLSAAEKQE